MSFWKKKLFVTWSSKTPCQTGTHDVSDHVQLLGKHHAPSLSSWLYRILVTRGQRDHLNTWSMLLTKYSSVQRSRLRDNRMSTLKQCWRRNFIFLWQPVLAEKNILGDLWLDDSRWLIFTAAYKLSWLLTLDNPLTRLFWHNWWSSPGWGGHQPPGRHWPFLTVKNNRLMEEKIIVSEDPTPCVQ